MRLQRISIKGFKGLSDVEFTLGPQGTVLIGANDAGKSMILDAIRFLLGQTDRFGRHFRSDDVGDAVVVGTFTDFSVHEQVWAPWLTDGNVMLGARGDYPERPLVLSPLSNALDRLADDEDFRRVLVEDGVGWYETQRHVGGVLEGALIMAALPMPDVVMLSGPEVGPADPVSLLKPLILNALHDAVMSEEAEVHFFKWHEIVRNELVFLREAIGEAASRYVIGAESADLAAPALADPGDAMPELLGLIGGDVSLDLISYGVDGKRSIKPLAHAGAGTRRALALSVLELYCDENLWPRGSRPLVIIVEEPEVGLHPGAQRRVADALRKLGSTGVQTIVVTHSPTIVDAAPRDGIRIVRRREDGTRDVIAPVELAEVTGMVGASASDVLLADRFLIVEGPSDAAIISIWARSRGWNLDDYRVKAYPADGWGNARGLAAFGQMAYAGARFYVVLDSGRDTVSEAKVIRERLGDRVEVTVLGRSGIEGYFTTGAIEAWLASQSVEGNPPKAPQSGWSKKALRELSNARLNREYRVVEDGVAIAGLMREQDVPHEIVDLLVRITSR